MAENDFDPQEWREMQCDHCGKETARYKRPVRIAVNLALVYAEWNPPQAVLCPGCFAELKGLSANREVFRKG